MSTPQELRDSDLSDPAAVRRRLAALTAYVAVLLRGPVELRLEAREALARPLGGLEGGKTLGKPGENGGKLLGDAGEICWNYGGNLWNNMMNNMNMGRF